MSISRETSILSTIKNVDRKFVDIDKFLKKVDCMRFISTKFIKFFHSTHLISPSLCSIYLNFIINSSWNQLGNSKLNSKLNHNDPGRSFLTPDLAGNIQESHRILQGNAGNIWNMEAVFPSGISRIFSDDFRTDPAGKHRNLSESTEKNPENSRPKYCFQLPSIFRCNPTVSRRTSFSWMYSV